MTSAVFWSVATVMVIFATAIIIVPLFGVRRDDASTSLNKRVVWMAIAGTTLLPLAALGVYSLLGSPNLLASAPDVASSTAAAAPHDGARPLSPTDPASDLGAATARLEAKLAQNPQDAAGWRLLAQSYAFAGRSAEADAANARAVQVEAGESVTGPAVSAGAPAAAQVPPADDSGLAALRERVRSNPRDTQSLALLAEGLRRKREFAEALTVFAQLVEKRAMTADLWADYADARGASLGGLDATSATYVQQALKLDPKHTKALWLLGSWQTEQRDYRSALATWQRLAALLPAESSDAKLIAANMAEARAALGGAAPPATPATAAAPASAQAMQVASAAFAAPAGTRVSGQVSLDARWKDRVAPGSVLFVFAKAVGQPGPPLAVLRVKTASWPISFVLDDSLAMMPNRKLSDFQNVVVEARISRAGTADPKPGDLRGVSAALDPRGAAPLRLVINEEIGG